LERGKEPKSELKRFGQRLQKEYPELMMEAMNFSRFVKLMVKTKYAAYHFSRFFL
jgi:hypothetical protein